MSNEPEPRRISPMRMLHFRAEGDHRRFYAGEDIGYDPADREQFLAWAKANDPLRYHRYLADYYDVAAHCATKEAELHRQEYYRLKEAQKEKRAGASRLVVPSSSGWLTPLA